MKQDEWETGGETPSVEREEPVAAVPTAARPDEDQAAAAPLPAESEEDQLGAEFVPAELEEEEEEERLAARADRAQAAPGERRRRHFGRRKVCSFCIEKVQSIDYKDPVKLRRYLSDRGRIEARRKTGTCAKHQRWLAIALKRARHLALLPYTPEHIRISGMFAARR